MQLLTVTLPENHTILLSADWHVGSVLSDETRIKTLLDEVKNNDNTYLALGGDLTEAICVDDKRFSIDVTTMTKPLDQAEYVYELLKPVKEKVLFSLDGNHELTHHRIGSIMEKCICKPLGIPYGTYTTKMTVKVNGKRAYGLFYWHGAKSIASGADDPVRALSNMHLSLKRKLKDKVADCEVMAIGHTHKLLCLGPTQRLYMAGDNKLKQYYTGGQHGNYIHPDHRWFLNTGSMMKLYHPGVSGYAERFGYDPVELGYCRLKYNGEISCEKMVL